MTSTMRRTINFVAVLAIAAGALAACGDDDGGSGDVPNLDGKWAVDSTSLDPSVASQVTNDNRPTIVFAGQTVSGFAGCNNYNASVTYDDKKMEFGPLAQTAMACPDPASSIETAFTTALASVRFYEKTGATLRMMNQDSQVVLTFGSA